MHCVSKQTDPQQIVDILAKQYLPISRFFVLHLEVGLFRRAYAYGPSLKILSPRLRRKKFYCGQHAGPCQATFFAKRHKLGSWLEGADWVGFNDMLNDALDAHSIEADIWSERESIGRLYVRQGRRRCRSYMADDSVGRGQHWRGNKHEECNFYESHFGCTTPAERSEYQEGTPGIPEWLASEERLPMYAALFEHEGKTRRQIRELAEAH